jgi:magnesium chelatase subunit I
MKISEPTIKTLGELRVSGYRPQSVKDELRRNLVKALREKSAVFTGILGYEDSVLPDLQRAILSRHNMILLGLRGQAKTRIARLMVELLDPYIPFVEGSELNDDPLQPISRYAVDLVKEKGDNTPIAWLHRSERYTEKLATPDVTIADLIGDADPIKAANLKLPYSDERVIHFGLVPRSHRGIFVINELPDLQPRIQVALFNILQEGDIQIRGFKLRLPLDIQFVFTANPEDYTNRGSIVTPLKDRIQSQILTHYPRSRQMAKEITRQEARLHEEQAKVKVHPLAEDLVEQIAFEARGSEYVDAKSGVSARLAISAMENLVSAAERRAIINGEDETWVRVSDFWGVVPAITGKIELVYEGEQEGPANVAQTLVGKSIRTLFSDYFPAPDNARKGKKDSVYDDLTGWFRQGNIVDLPNDMPDKEYRKKLESIPGLAAIVRKNHPKISEPERFFLMEFLLHGLAEYSLLSKSRLEKGLEFKDLLSGMFEMPVPGDDEDEDDL